MTQLKFIIGAAGTGKTTSTLKSLMLLNSEIACLAFTHSAVNNMKNIVSQLLHFPRTQTSQSDQPGQDSNSTIDFYTLHKFFQLPIPFKSIPINRHVRDRIKQYSIIVIDEFSLIPLDIIHYILDNLKEFCSSESMKIILIGDLLQLPPITPECDKSFNYKFFRKIWNPEYSLDVAYYLSNTIYCDDEYQKSDKMILTHNYRSNSSVMNILNDVFTNSYIPLTPLTFLSTSESNDYVIISSEYSILSDVLLKSNEYSPTGYPTKIGKTKSNKCILNETVDDEFLNGDVVEITKIYPEYDMVEITNSNKQTLSILHDKLLPYNFITVHKAQGRGYDNVVLILDSLFEITMLYTGITRAKNNIKFIIFNVKNQSKIEKNLQKSINQFNQLKTLISA